MKRASLAVAVALVAGCAHEQPIVNLPDRAIGEDLVDLVPSGPDLLVDVDVTQLDSWPTARRLLDLLPAAGKQRLQRLGDDPLARIDAVVVGVYRAGAADAEAATIVRGKLDWDALRGGAPEIDYHGATVVDRDAGEDSMARVTPRVLAFGSRAMVRRVLDVASRQDDSVRNGAVDKPLRDAFDRAPTAKLGRPALMLGLVATAPLREKLRAEKWGSAAELDWLALSFAVGDGFDVGIIGGAPGPAEANTLAELMQKRANELKSQVTMRLLGLVPYVDPFVVVAKQAEVHVAYRLVERRVDQLVTRLAQMQALTPRSPDQADQTAKAVAR
ncbi:MAG TPA: hypothetical protein VIA18_07300 [Polyangia bacterium]|nr:hypothetical protein [Polyangia bacterium]